jgi:hypothetical protein
MPEDSMEKSLSTFAAEMATSAMVLGECIPTACLISRNGVVAITGLD